MPNEQHYQVIGRNLEGAIESQLFGKPCFKVNSKPFVSFFDNCMVFKLTGDTHHEALSLDGAELFDPYRKGRAMKGWVQLPGAYSDRWEAFVRSAMEYVIQLTS